MTTKPIVPKLCTCTWSIPSRSDHADLRAPVRIPPRHIECSLHRQIQGEPQQPMHRYNRVPVLM